MVIRLLIGLLLFAAVPVMAADGTRIAPQLAQLQAQDSLLEQLQSRTREAETRAAEAERREREAEIKRLTDQAQQAQSRADAEAQRNLAAQCELFIQQAKTELHNSAYSRLEIIVGGFGALITAIVVFFAWNTKETAIAAAKAGVEDVRKTLVERLTEAEALLAKLHKHEIDFNERLRNLPPGEAPKSEEDRKTVTDVAREANAKPPRDLTANEYRAIIINLLITNRWDEMLEAAQQMRLLFSENSQDFIFARFQEAHALSQLDRQKEAVAVYENVIAHYAAAPVTDQREWLPAAWLGKGVAHGKLNSFEEEIAAYNEVLALCGAAPGDKLEDREWGAMAFFNMAAAYARQGKAKQTITTLQGMLNAGHPLHHEQIRNSPHFDRIRDDPAFKKFLDENNK